MIVMNLMFIQKFPRLYSLAVKALSVPATFALLERLFSDLTLHRGLRVSSKSKTSFVLESIRIERRDFEKKIDKE